MTIGKRVEAAAPGQIQKEYTLKGAELAERQAADQAHVDQYIEKVVKKIKNIAADEITNQYPEYKQRNALYELAINPDHSDSKIMFDNIKVIRAKSNLVETNLRAMSSEELLSININEYWQNA